MYVCIIKKKSYLVDPVFQENYRIMVCGKMEVIMGMGIPSGFGVHDIGTLQSGLRQSFLHHL